MMIDDKEIHALVITAHDLASKKYKGKRVRILCPHYNGQQCGSSRKPQTRKEFPVIDVVVDRFNGVVLFVEYGWVGISASKVEVVDNE